MMFDPASYSFSFYSLPVLVVGVLNGGLGIATLRRERASVVSVTFCAMTLSTTLWLLSFAAVYSTGDPSVARAWVLVEHFGLVLIPTTVFLFSAAVTGQLQEKQAFAWFSGAYAMALFGIVVGSDRLLTGVHHYFWGYYPTYGPLVPLLLGHFGVFLGASLHMYRVTAATTRSDAQRRRLKSILVALSIAYLGTVDFLPTFGVPVYPFGSLFICAFAVFAARAIWRYRLVDITPALAARQIINTMREGLLVIDRDGAIRLVNDAAADMFGTARANLLGAQGTEIDSRLTDSSLDRLVGSDDVSLSEASYRRRDGNTGTAIVSVSRLRDRRGEWVGTVHIFHDITERKRAEEQIRYLAFHDVLTGAANRSVLMDRLSQAVAQARRDGSAVGLIFIDLDGFKSVNDTRGHDAGDVLLRDIADQIRGLLREGDTLARVGGDEFVALLPRVHDADEAEQVAKRILSQLSERATAQASGVAASLGIAMYPQDGEEAETLLGRADAAMYEAKKSGGNTCRIFGSLDTAENSAA